MRKMKWLSAFLIVATLFGGILGCKQEVEVPSDKTAPADVTDLTATNKDASVLLTWTDATDEDIYGYEVTWNNNAPINRSAAMESNSMMVAPGAKGCYISNLTNGTEYAFTVKSVDTSGNKSAGVTKTITKTNTPTITVDAKKDISLVPSTTEKTNQDVTVKVEINSEIAESVEKILYKVGTNIDLSGTDITESKEFVVPENRSYSVVIKYTDGTFEFFFIDINNIDKTGPKPVSDVNIAYSKETGKITISWTNPADEDFAGTEIVYGKTGSKETKTLTFDKDTTLATIENIPADDSVYTIVIKTKDDVGNLSEAETLQVIARVDLYVVGDIILTDGTIVSAVFDYTIDEDNKPIGVVAMITDVCGVPTPKVIGLQRSGGVWARCEIGYNNIVCTPSEIGDGTASTATFTGDTDGSDNWEEICAVDPEGTQDAATNYPIFNFANTYGTTAGLTGTEYENGWYVPSIAELCEVYKNKDKIQRSLTKANGFEFDDRMYWSSSQSDSRDDCSFRVEFDEGFMHTTLKDNFLSVFVLQALTAE